MTQGLRIGWMAITVGFSVGCLNADKNTDRKLPPLPAPNVGAKAKDASALPSPELSRLTPSTERFGRQPGDPSIPKPTTNSTITSVVPTPPTTGGNFREPSPTIEIPRSAVRPPGESGTNLIATPPTILPPSSTAPAIPQPPLPRSESEPRGIPTVEAKSPSLPQTGSEGPIVAPTLPVSPPSGG